MVMMVVVMVDLALVGVVGVVRCICCMICWLVAILIQIHFINVVQILVATMIRTTMLMLPLIVSHHSCIIIFRLDLLSVTIAPRVIS